MKLEIAGIPVSVVSPNGKIRLVVNENYIPFLTSGHSELVFKLHYGYIPSVPLGKRIFGVSRQWGLYEKNSQRIIRAPDTPVPSRVLIPFKLLSLSKDFKSGSIYIRPPNIKKTKEIFPLVHPLCQLLYIILLSFNSGLLVHASAVIYRGRGFLFAGQSEAGKSTIARIWSKVKGAQVLSDDRVIVRKTNAGYRIYGTPWFGQERIISNKSAPLEKIFLLQHHEKNILIPMSKLTAITMLYGRMRLPHWDKEGLALSLKLIEEIARDVPLFKLGFFPDEGVVDFIRSKA